MTASTPDPPGGLPDEVVRVLEGSTDHQLQEVIHYAQQLLSERHSVTADIEPREGEEIVRVDDHDGYMSVVVERPEESGAARGPFAYSVQWEPDVEGDGGHYQWHYLGRVDE